MNVKTAIFLSPWMLLSTALGCATAAPDEPQAASAAALDDPSGTCPDYPRNTDCDAPAFVQRVYELAQEDPWKNAELPVGQASACISGLVAASAIEISSDGVTSVVLAEVVQVTGLLTVCREVSLYLARTGIPQNVSCVVGGAELPDRGVQQCECTRQCTSGWSNSGRSGDYSAPQVFSYGYLDRAATANCSCTNDAKEAACQWHCDGGWASDDPSDCTCLP